MTELVPVRSERPTQVSLSDLQDLLDARTHDEEARSGVSTRKSRVEDAKRAFAVDPASTLVRIRSRARRLNNIFDDSITASSVPLTEEQINRLSDEFYQLEKLRVELDALETRYRSLVYAHLDKTLPRVPGRPAAQVPGKVKATGPGPHYEFERRGGGRKYPVLDTEGLREALPAEVVAELYKTVHHKAVEARSEEVFDEARFAELVNLGVIKLGVVADYLTPGEWRTPAFYKTLVDG